MATELNNQTKRDKLVVIERRYKLLPSQTRYSFTEIGNSQDLNCLTGARLRKS